MYKSDGVWKKIVSKYVDDSVTTYRLMVPGGWIYRTVTINGDSSTFVPRPAHYIDGEDEPGWLSVKSIPQDNTEILIWCNYPSHKVAIGEYLPWKHMWMLNRKPDDLIYESNIVGWMYLPILISTTLEV